MTTVIVRRDEPPATLDVEKARDALARCKSVDQAKDLRDKATAIAVYMRTRSASLEALNDAIEIKLRAERRLGELRREAPKAKTGPAPKFGPPKGPKPAPTLAEQGITKNQSARWQAIAAVPESTFEQYVAETRAKAERLSSKAVLSRAKPKKLTDDGVLGEPVDPNAWHSDAFLRDVERELSERFREWRAHGGNVQHMAERLRALVRLEEKTQ